MMMATGGLLTHQKVRGDFSNIVLVNMETISGTWLAQPLQTTPLAEIVAFTLNARVDSRRLAVKVFLLVL